MGNSTQQLQNWIRLNSLQLNSLNIQSYSHPLVPINLCLTITLTYKTAPLSAGESLRVWEGTCLLTVYLSWCFLSSNSLRLGGVRVLPTLHQHAQLIRVQPVSRYIQWRSEREGAPVPTGSNNRWCSVTMIHCWWGEDGDSCNKLISSLELNLFLLLIILNDRFVWNIIIQEFWVITG